MNKKLVFLAGAAVATVGFALVTGFGGMTKAQQMQMIDEKVNNNLVTLRADKTKECDESVAKAAAAKADAMMAAPAAQEPAKGPAKPTKKPTKGGNSKGGKVDPLPQPTPPAKKDDTEAGKAKGRINGEAPAKQEAEKAKSRIGGEAPAAKEVEKAKGRIKSGGGN